ncbi:MAG: hypothetical protein ABII12_18865 [Planctomycetota bacterium]
MDIEGRKKLLRRQTGLPAWLDDSRHDSAPPLHADLKHFLGPAGLSLSCHGLFILVMALAAWAAIGSPDADAIFTEFEAKVVSQTKSEGPQGGYRFPGRANIDRPDSTRASASTGELRDLAELLDAEPAFQPDPIDPGGSGLGTLAVSQLGRGDVVGIGGGEGPAAEGLGNGLGDRDLAGGGPVGSLWGVGKGQRARSIVYVMDRSASMAETFSLLQRELLRAIGSLDADQSFNVIWFNEGDATPLAERMLSATIHNKRKAFKAIKDIYPRGQTEPIDAIKRGLAYTPDVLFLLSDGDFAEDNKLIMRMIEKKNENQRTRINTILFVYDTVGDGERVLRTIAEKNGGTFKHVTEEDIRR